MNVGRWLMPASVAALVTSVIAALGATITLLGPWYHSLVQPSWAPPDMAFGPAWTLIFALCAISAATAWMAAPTRDTANMLIGLYAFNGFLNLLWSFLFFRFQRPDIAAVQVWVLWLSVAVLILVTRRYSRAAAWLLLPYLLWVSFAGALNVAVAARNGPFG
ncbi:MAG: tryptophan-rich sensory protein [Sandarakinorhabdus sp.]|nr:tryptophan-rich sensory protein [Sandarakinorhabdus sp.]